MLSYQRQANRAPYRRIGIATTAALLISLACSVSNLFTSFHLWTEIESIDLPSNFNFSSTVHIVGNSRGTTEALQTMGLSTRENYSQTSVSNSLEINKESRHNRHVLPLSRKPRHFVGDLFPRWKQESISWEAIEEYILWANEPQQLDQGRDFFCYEKREQYRNLLTSGILNYEDNAKPLYTLPPPSCAHDSPNVIFLWGATRAVASLHPPSTVASSTNTTNVSSFEEAQHTGLGDKSHYVWVEGRRRKRVGTGFKKRYPIIESLLDDALQHLMKDSKEMTTNSSINYQVETGHKSEKSLYPRLTEVLKSHPSSPSYGIPMVVNLGDNQICFDSVFKKKWNVPVWTLAAPISCEHAFLLPHPAAIDTAQTYGDHWTTIQARRKKTYPDTRQHHQAIWRGSPTGDTHVRKHLVKGTNTIPADFAENIEIKGTTDQLKNQKEINENNTNETILSTIFDVGFGKPYHKIVPAYHGPRIAGRPRVDFEDFGAWKMVLDVDGSSWSERFVCLICLRTVVGKVEPNFVDWLWPTLQEYTHFVPLKKSSLETNRNNNSSIWHIVNATLNDLKMRRQIMQATEVWCEKHMKYNVLIEHVLESLEKYVSWLDQGRPDWQQQYRDLLDGRISYKHHHWQPLPVQRPKPYFSLWRDRD